MTWYAVYRQSNGELFSIGTVLAPSEVLEQNGLIAMDVGDQNPSDMIWDKVNKKFAARPSRKKLVTKAEFVELFSETEWELFSTYPTSTRGTAATRQSVGGILEMFRQLDVIDMNNPRIQSSITKLSTVQSAPITPARAAEIIG
jgi:hypothetical protein